STSASMQDKATKAIPASTHVYATIDDKHYHFPKDSLERPMLIARRESQIGTPHETSLCGDSSLSCGLCSGPMEGIARNRNRARLSPLSPSNSPLQCQSRRVERQTDLVAVQLPRLHPHTLPLRACRS